MLHDETPVDSYPLGPLSERAPDEIFGSVDAEPRTYAVADDEAIPELGATDTWQREIREGKRTKYDFDALFRAACAEANARDALREGFVAIANAYRREAAYIMLENFVGTAA
jgi:hypothetical protein